MSRTTIDRAVAPASKRAGMARGRHGVPAAAVACGAVLVWSTNALAGGTALERLTVLQVLALEFGGAFGVLALWRFAMRQNAPSSRQAGVAVTVRVVAVGTVGVAGTLGLQYLAFATAPLLAANAIAYAWPLMVAAWATLAARSSRGRASLVLALIGFAGVILIFSQGHASQGGTHASIVGYVAALASAVAMAWYTLAAGKVGADTGDLLLIGTGIGAAVTVPLALFQGAAWASGWGIALSLFVGVGPLAAGYAMWTQAMADPIGPRLAPIAYGTPLFSTLLLLFSGRRLPLLGLVGCALITLCAAGVVIDSVQHNRRSVPADLNRSHQGSSSPDV